MPIEIGNPFGDQTLTLFGGFELDRMGALIALSMAFLGYVIINGMFKLYINTYKGQLGERMLRRLRYQLVRPCSALSVIRNTAGCEGSKSQP